MLDADIRDSFGGIDYERLMQLVARRVSDRRWSGVKDVREVIGNLNPILRGWGAYFRTGNAAKKFNRLDICVWKRSCRFLI